MRRRLVLIFAGCFALFAIGLATLPWWLGMVLAWSGPSRGLTFASYERVGYSRFVLRDVEVRRGQVTVTVASAEVDTPLLWGWRHWRGEPRKVVVGQWSVSVAPSPAPLPPNPQAGWVTLRATLFKIAAQLDRWLPAAKAGPGEVRWKTGRVAAASADWKALTLTLTEVGYGTSKLNVGGVLVFDLKNDTLHLTLPGATPAGSLHLVSQGAAVKGDVVLWEQRGTAEALFAARGWLPLSGTLQAEDWTLAGERLKLGPSYQRVRGRGGLIWREGTFTAEVTAVGEPVEGKKVPPLNVALRGRGDLQTFTVEALQAKIPGLEAQLSEPLTVGRDGKFREGAARFTLELDLEKQPWFEASGQVKGEARLVTSGTGVPLAEFSIAAQEVAAQGVKLSEVSARGRLDWPQLQVESVSVMTGQQEKMALQGGWDFVAKEFLDTTARGQLRRSSFARWLPAQPVFDVVDVDASVQGPLASLVHRGKASATGVVVAGVKPLSVQASWRGQADVVQAFELEVASPGTKVHLTGKADRQGATLGTLTYTQGEAQHLQLKAPAQIRWQPQLQIDRLHLGGPQGNLEASVTWGARGAIEVKAQRISSQWFSELLVSPGPSWEVAGLAVNGQWDNGPLSFALQADAAIELGQNRKAVVTVKARGDKEAIHIDSLSAAEGADPIVKAAGRIPIVLVPFGNPRVQFKAEESLAIDLATEPNAAFWQQLTALTGVELQDPEVIAHVTGTWARPQGELNLKARRVVMDTKRFKQALPRLDGLEIVMTGDIGEVRLDTFSARVEGQAVRAKGRLAVTDGNWRAVFKEPFAFARRGGQLRIEIPDAEIGAFSRYLPAFLAPKGKLQVDLSYKGGDMFDGTLILRDAASRPLGPLGVLQEISADVHLNGREVELRSVQAKAGGQPVTLKGKVELRPDAEPKYDLSLEGKNLPFVRQAGLLVRGDLDLKLQTAAVGPTTISGVVRLRDSLFLSDVRAFLTRGGQGAKRRPPYFSIETPPLNGWLLAVEVTGDHFMRLRTPLFTGVASARLRLTGTLGEPRAIGEVEMNEGRVLMPFASFDVKQGAVRLTEENPFEPVIFMRGTTRRYGYDLAMEVSGPATAPNVVFSSSPALDSEQVILLVMTGSIPSNAMSKTGRQRVPQIGAYLGQSLLGSLWGDSGDASRLSISSGEKISRQGKETYNIDYRLNDRWTVTGENDEFDDFNAGLKWKILPRPTPQENAARDAQK